MASTAKRKRPAANTLPITAFFERKRPTPATRETPVERADAGASDARNEIEEIDDDAREIEEPSRQDASEVTRPTSAAESEQARQEPQRVNTVHLTRILVRRELGAGAARGVPASSRSRIRQQIAQRLTRFALAQFQLLPLQLVLPDDAMRIVRSHRLVSHSGEFFASCMAFDSQGALLVAGSSNGVIALFDCDELFFHTINLTPAPATSTTTRELNPLHMIFTGMEVQRVRWNPANEDEIACCFLNRNEIFLYNLQKFPNKPYQVLKASSRPSSGYTDLVFLPAPVSGMAPGTSMTAVQKKKLRSGVVVAGDVDGMLRAWDLRFPTRPQWAVSTGSQPIATLTLSHDMQTLICGTEGGVVLTYDVNKLVVPAFGSKPMPQRMTLIRLADALRPCLSPEATAVLKAATRDSLTGTTLAVASIQLVPSSNTQIIVQLRNQWLLLLDVDSGNVVKQHTPVKEPSIALGRAMGSSLPASVLHSGREELLSQQQAAASRQRYTWLGHHRCSASLAFHGAMLCAGLPDEAALSIVDLNRLDSSFPQDNAFPSRNYGMPLPPSPSSMVERLSRFRIITPDQVTAVAVHPTQHWILCGGADLRIRIFAPGAFDESEAEESSNDQ